MAEAEPETEPETERGAEHGAKPEADVVKMPSLVPEWKSRWVPPSVPPIRAVQDLRPLMVSCTPPAAISRRLSRPNKGPPVTLGTWVGGGSGPSPASVVASLFTITCSIFVMAAMALRNWDDGLYSEGDQMCTTDDCRQHATRLSQTVGTSGANPCGDFERYVCGGWAAEGPYLGTVAQAATAKWLARISSPAFLQQSDDGSNKQAEQYAGVHKAMDLLSRCIHRPGETKEATERLWRKFLDDNNFVWHRLNERNVLRDHAVSALERLVVFAVRWRLPWCFDVVYMPGATGGRSREFYLTPSPLIPTFYRAVEELSVFPDGVGIVWEALLAASRRNPITDVDRYWAGRTVALQSRVLRILRALRQAPGGGSSGGPVPRTIPLYKMATVNGSLSPSVWTSALQAALRVYPAVSMRSDVLHVVDTRVLDAVELLFAENDEFSVRVNVEWSIVLFFGTMILSDAAAYLRRDRYGAEVLQQLCGLHVESVFAFPLAQHDKEARTPEEMRRLREVLAAVKDAVLHKVEGGDWPWELRAAISSRVNATTTVMWTEKDGDERGEQWLLFRALYANMPTEGALFFQRWSSAVQYVDDWHSPLQPVLLRRLRRTLPDELVHYDPADNTITLSPAALGSPFFYARAPNAVLYAGLGYLYARELARAVDYAESLLQPTVAKARPRGATRRVRMNGGLPSDSPLPAQMIRGQLWGTDNGERGALSMAESAPLTKEALPLLNLTLTNISSEAAEHRIQASETAFPPENDRTEAEMTLSRRWNNGSQLTSSKSMPPAANASPENGTQRKLPSNLDNLTSRVPAAPEKASSTSVSKPTWKPALQVQQPLCNWKGKSHGEFLDVTALELAYAAFEKVLRLGENVRLMELRQFSTEQLFFLSACYTGCRRGLRPQGMGCNEALINLEAFAKAFGCRPGSFMNPAERCRSPWLRVPGP